jgi:peptidoglycan/LPS O-acetylase OafA/YrhL
VAAWTRLTWADDSDLSAAIAQLHSIHEHLLAHVIAHLTMFHGAISSNLLPFSAYAFNGAAWSLSLEWQFYLLAPLFVFLALQRRLCLLLVGTVVILELAYNLGLLGRFESPSFLPGAAGYFAIGIASRFMYPWLAGRMRYPLVTAAVIVMVIPLNQEFDPLLIWSPLMTGLTLDRSEMSPFASVYRTALESPIVTYLGSRSYSVYLTHGPVLGCCLLFWADHFPAGGRSAAPFILSAMVIPLTAAVAEVFYRCVEAPGIALGAWLTRGRPSVLAVAPPVPNV